MPPAMRDWLGPREIARFDSMRDANGDLPPPWRVFPEYPPTSMGWRMGGGETYMSYWHCIYDDLSDADKKRYRRKHPRPLYWFWFYWNLESVPVAIILIPISLLTFPLRVFLHWGHRLFGPERIGIPSLPEDSA